MKKLLLGIAAILLSANAVAQQGGVLDKDSGIVTKPSKYPVTETIDRLETDIKSRDGIQIFARIDFQALAATQGGKVRPGQLLIFGGGRLAQPFISAAPTVAIDLPMKVLAWEDETGKVWVSYNTGEYLKDRHAIKGRDEFLRRLTELSESFATKARQ
jgi:uncharacterized protein (DUF302 family)